MQRKIKKKINRIDFNKGIVIVCIFFLFGIFTHMAIGIKKSDYIELENEKGRLIDEISKIKDEFGAYKDKFGIYESVSLEDVKTKAEKEKEEINNERKELERKYAADRTSIREQAAKKAFASRGNESGYQKVSFLELSINPGKYYSKKVEMSCTPYRINRHNSGFYSIAAVTLDTTALALIAIEPTASASLRNMAGNIRSDEEITVRGVFQGVVKNFNNPIGQKSTAVIISAREID